MLGYCKPPGGSDWAAIEVETNALVFEYTPLLAGLVPGLPYPIRSERVLTVSVPPSTHHFDGILTYAGKSS